MVCELSRAQSFGFAETLPMIYDLTIRHFRDSRRVHTYCIHAPSVLHHLQCRLSSAHSRAEPKSPMPWTIPMRRCSHVLSAFKGRGEHVGHCTSKAKSSRKGLGGFGEVLLLPRRGASDSALIMNYSAIVQLHARRLFL
jgi:hypothetical protein